MVNYHIILFIVVVVSHFDNEEWNERDVYLSTICSFNVKQIQRIMFLIRGAC